MHMRTHIELDDKLLHQVLQLGGFATKKEAVGKALEEFAKRLKRDELLKLQGKVKWRGDLRKLRALR